MKLKLYSLAFFFILLSCKNGADNENVEIEDNGTNNEYNAVGPGIPVEEDASNNESVDRNNTSPEIQAGNYIKTGHKTGQNCQCYCLNISLSETSNLCLVENEMYITSTFERDGDRINVFYNSTSEENKNSDLPWDKFDKDKPIAVLEPQPNGQIHLDWKGFSINGELAVDYAIFGKKNLEGTYEKK
ncbi:hypothetical protein [Autumnicola musiva]|uniref:Lipoprotein n=1 Tax=Autumnicola musiva TaxID=3075589 RepID=A0ABU3D2L1_9FLAO|nr:hypothetical protein [Zunongwangia sp. F117]MDT0675775.1 hypothetical protein [Zunongwangia sp. F117]